MELYEKMAKFSGYNGFEPRVCFKTEDLYAKRRYSKLRI